MQVEQRAWSKIRAARRVPLSLYSLETGSAKVGMKMAKVGPEKLVPLSVFWKSKSICPSLLITVILPVREK